MQFERREDSIANSATLPLTFVSAVTSATLPFRLRVREDSQANAGGLPFVFGIGDGAGVSDDNAAPEKLVACFALNNTPTASLSADFEDVGRAMPASRGFDCDYGVTITVAQCHEVVTEHFVALGNCSSSTTTAITSLENCHHGQFADIEALNHCVGTSTTVVDDLSSCRHFNLPKPVSLDHCVVSNTPPIVAYSHCAVDENMAYALSTCATSETVPAVPVPCQWYKIELPPPPPTYQTPCGEPPKSDALPFAFARREAQSLDNDLLPFGFLCHYTPEETRRKTYMIYNTVTAEIDGQPIGIYTAQISTSMDAFCWQFSVEIRHDDFAKLRLDARDDDPLLMLTVNGHQWVMLVEDYGERKAFNRDSYTLTGRSRTALLTGDYAKRKTQLVDTALNASQLAQAQLEGTGFTLVWDNDADWFIPANTYSVSGTPIETIMDIANAGGHYVASHPTEAKLFVRKRWAKPAWEIAAATAERQISALTWLELQGNRRVSTRYNSVRLVGSGKNAKGGYIVRTVSAGQPLPEASIVTSPLYAGNDSNTPVAAFRNKGIQILSECGKHKDYTIKQLWADDATNSENIKLAQLGEIVDVFDVGGSLGKGRTTGVSVEISEDNQATSVHQTTSIDVYLDE